MNETIHVAITRRIRKEHAREYERLLGDFASQSLTDPASRGVHLLYPVPGAKNCEYGILRSFASAADRDAFYGSNFYKEFAARVESMMEEEPTFRQLDGLEAWFRESRGAMPPRWKMAVLTWIAVWPVSMIVPALLGPWLGGKVSPVIGAGIGAALIVVVLTWAAMPLLVRVARPWLHHSSPQPTAAKPTSL